MFSINFQPKANQMGGKKMIVPIHQVDPNTNVAMYESDNIFKYLVEKYGSLCRFWCSIHRAPRLFQLAKLPEKLFKLWGSESSSFCKIARGAFSELEIPHIYHSCARGSTKRDLLLQKTGKFQVPFLEDPNTSAASNV